MAHAALKRVPLALPLVAPVKGSIDAADFDPEKYVNKLLKDSSLHDLVSRANQLSTEVKALDGDMQMLVYENYNKFISATDTIRQACPLRNGCAVSNRCCIHHDPPAALSARRCLPQLSAPSAPALELSPAPHRLAHGGRLSIVREQMRPFLADVTSPGADVTSWSLRR